jgi:hypothetical protein
VPFAAPKNALEATILELVDVRHADNAELSYTAKREQIIEILKNDFSFDKII